MSTFKRHVEQQRCLQLRPWEKFPVAEKISNHTQTCRTLTASPGYLCIYGNCIYCCALKSLPEKNEWMR